MTWGTYPILNEAGDQCCSVADADAAVRKFWVDQVLRRHASVDAVQQWALFQTSTFGSHIPKVQWQHVPWTGALVRQALGSMREGAAPGPPGIPIAVWKALPTMWTDAVAHLFNGVETEGAWPQECLEAYVVMILKSAGGSRPQVQRPITILPLLYRIWSKGVALQWAGTLQTAYLGPAAMGFRAQTGTLFVAQLLADVIAWQKRQGKELWLISFDVEKCYDSIPWWALFGVMRQAGVVETVVHAFEAFYKGLRRRFRYGQVEGESWQAANSLLQGCPSAPDQLNMLLEPFHRWCAAQDLGVQVRGRRVASVSFADDVALVGGSKAQAHCLVAAYL